MARPLINLIDQKFGKWKVVSYAGEGRWNCVCECGNLGVVKTGHLKLSRSSKCKLCANNQFKDLKGQIFGLWIVKERSIQPSKWICICQKCGSERHVYTTHITSGHSKACIDCANKTGYKEITGAYWCTIVSGAKDRNLEFNITLEYAWNLYVLQNRICALTNMSIVFRKNIKCRADQTASLDRIDSTKGYIEGNVQWVHRDINIMKREYNQNYFIKMCKMVAETH